MFGENKFFSRQPETNTTKNTKRGPELRLLGLLTTVIGLVGCKPAEEPKQVEVVSESVEQVKIAENTAEIRKVKEQLLYLSIKEKLEKRYKPIAKQDVHALLKFGAPEHALLEITGPSENTFFYIAEGDLNSTTEADIPEIIGNEHEGIEITQWHTHPLNKDFINGMPKNLQSELTAGKINLPIPPSLDDLYMVILDEQKSPSISHGIVEQGGKSWKYKLNKESELARPGVFEAYKQTNEKIAKLKTSNKKMFEQLNAAKKRNDIKLVDSIRSSKEYQNYTKKVEELRNPDYSMVHRFLMKSTFGRGAIWGYWEEEQKIGEKTQAAIERFQKELGEDGLHITYGTF